MQKYEVTVITVFRGTAKIEAISARAAEQIAGDKIMEMDLYYHDIQTLYAYPCCDICEKVERESFLRQHGKTMICGSCYQEHVIEKDGQAMYED